MATMGLSCIVSEIDGDFRIKSQIFPTPVYFAPQPKGFPLELSIGAWCRKLKSWGYRPRDIFDDIFSRLDTMHERDGQTDGSVRLSITSTDIGRQQRPRYSVAR